MTTALRSTHKYQPRGLTVLHEDREIIVVEKPCGLLSIGTDRDKTRTVHSILNDYVRKGDPRSRNRIYIVHRLDRDTSGILVLAKSESSKHFLQEHWAECEKHYLAVVHGLLAEKTSSIGSYLAENSAQRVYGTNDSSLGKWAQTEYTVLKEFKGLSLLEVRLLTGRKHQIRVHMAEAGHPLVGDRKYGRPNDHHPTLALHAHTLTFTHPVNGRRFTFTTTVPAAINRLVGEFDLPSL